MRASENIKKVGRQIFLYLIVGAGATLIEWGVFLSACRKNVYNLSCRNYNCLRIFYFGKLKIGQDFTF